MGRRIGRSGMIRGLVGKDWKTLKEIQAELAMMDQWMSRRFLSSTIYNIMKRNPGFMEYDKDKGVRLKPP